MGCVCVRLFAALLYLCVDTVRRKSGILQKRGYCHRIIACVLLFMVHRYLFCKSSIREELIEHLSFITSIICVNAAIPKVVSLLIASQF